MSRWRALIWCGILVVGLPSMAGAQGFKWWQEDRFKTELALTPDQSAKLEEVFQGLYPRMTGGKESLDRLEKRLSEPDRPGHGPGGRGHEAGRRGGDARAALNRTRTLMVYRMHLLLTPEQRVKMKALHDRWEQERRKDRRATRGADPRRQARWTREEFCEQAGTRGNRHHALAALLVVPQAAFAQSLVEQRRGRRPGPHARTGRPTPRRPTPRDRRSRRRAAEDARGAGAGAPGHQADASTRRSSGRSTTTSSCPSSG